VQTLKGRSPVCLERLPAQLADQTDESALYRSPHLLLLLLPGLIASLVLLLLLFLSSVIIISSCSRRTVITLITCHFNAAQRGTILQRRSGNPAQRPTKLSSQHQYLQESTMKYALPCVATALPAVTLAPCTKVSLQE
jgi:cobalamin synthase